MARLRVSSDVWVFALKKRLEAQAIPIYITKKGDEKAGSIIIRLLGLYGKSKLFFQIPSETGERRWTEFANDSDYEVESFLRKQKKIDADLWILEVEEVNCINFFEEFLLEI